MGCAGSGAAPTSSVDRQHPELLLIEEEGKSLFVVDGLGDNPKGEEGASQFKVQVDLGSDTPAMVGTYHREGSRLIFAPRFRLTPGLSYRAIYRSAPDAASLERQFIIPAVDLEPSTSLAQVYPSSDELPENLLRIYVEFSAAMQQVSSYEHIQLIHSSGQVVELPFLELPEELWSRDGRRLTLLFDPGRIKRGLKPRRDVGSALLAGESYSLLVDGELKDARGVAILSGHRKDFRAMAVDRQQPNPDHWHLSSPEAGTRKSLTVEFDEALDHALLQRMVWVTAADGKEVDGEIRLGAGEKRIEFIPELPWNTGKHSLVIDVDLEDLAGNSLRSVFDRDLGQPGRVEPPETEVIRIPFAVSEASR